MDIQAVKWELMQKLMGINQESLLKKLTQIVEKEAVVGYTVDGKPLTQQAYNKRLEKAEQQIRKGAYLTQEELEKEIENW